MPGDGKGLPVIVEAFRRAMLEVLVPEIRTMQKQLDEHSGILREHSGILREHSGILREHSGILKEHSGILQELREGQVRLLQQVDVVQRLARLEVRVEQMHRA